MRKILIVAAVLILSGAARIQAQQVIPVISEAKIKHTYKGQFTVQNNSVVPMPVTVEPKELIGGPDGQPAFRPLPDDVRVELNDTSAVISPKGQRTFDFKITSERTVAVSFFNGMTTGKTKEGVTIKLWLPSVFYLCTDNAKDCRTRSKASLGITQ